MPPVPTAVAGAEEPPAHIPYKVISQEKTQQLTPDGRFVDVWRVAFQDEAGHHSFIEVPVNEYTPANVDRLIEQELDTIMGVHELGPEPHPENTAE